MREKYNGYKSTFGQVPEPPRGNGKGMFLLCLICGIAAMTCFGVVGQSAYSKHVEQQRAAAVQLAQSQAAAVQRIMTVFPKAPGVRSKMPNYRVTGAGDPGVDGDYIQGADVSGYPAYYFGDYSIQFQNGSGYWAIINTSTYSNRYQATSYNGNPDSYSYEVYYGDSPAPTVTAIAADTTPPTIDSTTGASVPTTGNRVDVPMIEADSSPVLPATGVTGFTVKVNGVTRTVTSATAASVAGGVTGYNVSGFGDTGYNGIYTEIATVNGKPQYQLDASHYLTWADGASVTSGYFLSSDNSGDDSLYVYANDNSATPDAAGGGWYGSPAPVGTVTAETAPATNTITLNIANKIYQGDTVTVEYAPGNVTDSADTPNAMAAFGAQSVTNNSTVERTLYKPAVWLGNGMGNLPNGEQLIQPAPAPVQQLTDGATITWDCSDAQISKAKVTLGGNRTLALEGITSGSQGILFVKQDATGGRTLVAPAGSKVVSGGSGTFDLTAGANAVDAYAFVYDGTTFYWTRGPNFT